MSTMVEIQSAMERLPTREQQALSAWLSSRDEAELSPADEARLLARLDRAARQLDAGEGVPSERVRRMVSEWAK